MRTARTCSWRCGDGIVRVGPFVVPGATACLRCLDAHLGERTPGGRWCCTSTPRPGRRGVGVPDPVPHDLLDLALAWAVRDLVGVVDGRRPPTWSATVQVDPALDAGADAVAGAPGLRLRLGPAVGAGSSRLAAHHHSLSSLDSIARRCSREQVSQKTRFRPFSTAVVQVSRHLVGLRAAEVARRRADLATVDANNRADGRRSVGPPTRWSRHGIGRGSEGAGEGEARLLRGLLGLAAEPTGERRSRPRCSCCASPRRADICARARSSCMKIHLRAPVLMGSWWWFLVSAGEGQVGQRGLAC